MLALLPDNFLGKWGEGLQAKRDEIPRALLYVCTPGVWSPQEISFLNMLEKRNKKLPKATENIEVRLK